MEERKGYVRHIIYRNEENGYTVFEFSSGGEVLTCVGTLPVLNDGESCLLAGEITRHPVYGEQFKVESSIPCAPEDAQGVLRYLSSGAVKGIGEALAARIIDAFGDDALRVMEEEPERLSEVRGISEKKAREIAAQLEGEKDLRDAVLYMQRYGISARVAMRLYRSYGTEIYTVLQENPYRLAEEVDGIGFVQADRIARRLGIRADSAFRIRSAVFYVLENASVDGNSFLPEQDIVSRTAAILSGPEDETAVSEDAVRAELGGMAVERSVILRRKDGVVQVYAARAFLTEQQIAGRLLELSRFRVREGSKVRAAEVIRAMEEEEAMPLDELQREAVRLCEDNAILLISGGPGTGKTTTIRTILKYFTRNRMNVLLAAPTGRAAKRMSALTGFEAQTIHRLLGVHPVATDDADGRKEAVFRRVSFDRDESDPLDADAVIIDEMSMVDMYLFLSLLKAVSPGTRLILVGDANQLPSVGPGSVLKDLISSGLFPTVILSRIFRQAARSEIVRNAHRILNGEEIALDKRDGDFFFLERNDVGVIYKHIVQLLRDMLPGYLGCRSEEIQVLTPMRKGSLGVGKLNEVLQSVLNPPVRQRREIRHGETVLREGDKVMQTRNNYQITWEVRGNFGIPIETGQGVFNGDFGIVEEIDTAADTVTVRYDDDRMVDYRRDELDDLELAYAITVHKSQGTEYPAVILPLLSGPPALMTRNLLYTAVTRAKSAVVLIGSRECIKEMENNVNENARCTGLKDRLDELCGASFTAKMPGV